jgi:taurine dioxygenase
VWTNPETGQDVLWLSPISTVDFRGISREDGRKLIDDLWEFAASVDPEFTYVHRWAPGDMVIWDNRMLHHARMPFESSEPRTLRRNSIL